MTFSTCAFKCVTMIKCNLLLVINLFTECLPFWQFKNITQMMNMSECVINAYMNGVYTNNVKGLMFDYTKPLIYRVTGKN